MHHTPSKQSKQHLKKLANESRPCLCTLISAMLFRRCMAQQYVNTAEILPACKSRANFGNECIHILPSCQAPQAKRHMTQSLLSICQAAVQAIEAIEGGQVDSWIPGIR